jgi:uncharacterized protein YndB with AHSA1/START domain
MLAPSFGVSRTFDTTLERLWKAFTDGEEMAAWALPPGATVLRNSLNLSVGGLYRFGVALQDGAQVWGAWDIRRIEPPSLLKFTFGLAGDEGGAARNPLDPNCPAKFQAEFRLAPQYGGTTVTINFAPVEATEAQAIAFRQTFGALSQGWERALARLDARLTPFRVGSS